MVVAREGLAGEKRQGKVLDASKSKQVVKWVTVPPADQAGNKTKTYFFVDSARNQGFCSC